MPPLRPLRQGTEEQRLASAPSRGAALVAASSVQEPCGSGSQSLGKQNRRSRVVQVVFMANAGPLVAPRSVLRSITTSSRFPDVLPVAH